MDRHQQRLKICEVIHDGLYELPKLFDGINDIYELDKDECLKEIGEDLYASFVSSKDFATRWLEIKSLFQEVANILKKPLFQLSSIGDDTSSLAFNNSSTLCPMACSERELTEKEICIRILYIYDQDPMQNLFCTLIPK